MPAQSLHCPACGAPILLRGESAVLNCPYCRSSVVVPADLRPAAKDIWSTLVFDNFTTNANHWLLGSQAGEHFDLLDRTLVEGRYRWEGQIRRPNSITVAWLRGYPVGDFHLAVTAKHSGGSRAGSAQGVVFRVQDNHNYFFFRVIDTQTFAVSVIENNQWRTVLDWTRSDAIKPNGVNQLEVLARDQRFTFLINGQVVGEAEDQPSKQGLVGLAIEAFDQVEAFAFDFLDLVLRAPAA